MKAIITAAGQSSRLWETTGREPKTLLPFGESSILSAILHNFAQVGIRDFVIVTGYRGDLIAQHLRDHDNFGMNVQLLDNPEWHRGNGLSVLRALAYLAPEEPVILSMADHVVSPAALAAVRALPGMASRRCASRRGMLKARRSCCRAPRHCPPTLCSR